MTESLNDVTAHAEMQAITMAADVFGGKYLNEFTIYVTLEPCPMCAAALSWAQIGEVVFGAYDSKRGYSLFSPSLLHPKTKVVGGVCEEECSALVKSFLKRGGVSMAFLGDWGYLGLFWAHLWPQRLFRLVRTF